MTENNKKIILIIGGALVIILAIFVIWWQFFRNITDVQVTNINTSQPVTTNTNVEIIDLTNNTNQTVEVVVDENLSMTRLANIFTERYGSFTSESEFKNSLDLKVYMTSSLINTIDSYLATQSNLSSNGEYFSVVTKVISNKIITSNDSNGTVELITQRTENIGDVEDVYYQDITLELTYDNEVWLVNKVTWGDKQ